MSDPAFKRYQHGNNLIMCAANGKIHRQKEGVFIFLVVRNAGETSVPSYNVGTVSKGLASEVRPGTAGV